MEALELDEEMRRLEADPSGPMSSHIDIDQSIRTFINGVQMARELAA
jgi:hypothetical protein